MARKDAKFSQKKPFSVGERNFAKTMSFIFAEYLCKDLIAN
jgi:hypothetical protein